MMEIKPIETVDRAAQNREIGPPRERLRFGDPFFENRLGQVGAGAVGEAARSHGSEVAAAAAQARPFPLLVRQGVVGMQGHRAGGSELDAGRGVVKDPSGFWTIGKLIELLGPDIGVADQPAAVSVYAAKHHGPCGGSALGIDAAQRWQVEGRLCGPRRGFEVPPQMIEYFGQVVGIESHNG